MTNDMILIIPPEAAGKRLSDYLNLEGHAFSAPCGGRGVCKKCRVKVVSGTFGTVGAPEQPLLPDEEGYLLACQAVCPAEGEGPKSVLRAILGEKADPGGDAIVYDSPEDFEEAWTRRTGVSHGR